VCFSILLLGVAGESASWDYNPRVNYEKYPLFLFSYRQKSKWRFNPILFDPKIPRKYNGYALGNRFRNKNFSFYVLFNSLHYLNRMTFSLLFRFNRLYRRPPYPYFENFLAYLYLKFHITLYPARKSPLWGEIDRGSRFLIADSIKIYRWGKQMGWRRDYRSLGWAVGALCQRELLLLRIIASNPQCGCYPFLYNTYRYLWYYCHPFWKIR